MFKKLIPCICLFILIGCAGRQIEPQEQYITKSELAAILSSTDKRPSIDTIEELMESSGTGARAFTAYEGTGTGALGKVACTSLSTGDQAWVQTDTEVSFFTFNSTDATAQDTTDKTYINCYDASWTAGNWMLSSPRFLNFVVNSSGVINPSGTPSIKWYDDNQSRTSAQATLNDDGNDAILDFDVMEDDSLTEYMSLDGGTEEIIVSKPIDSSAAITVTSLSMAADANPTFVMDDTVGDSFTLDLNGSEIDFIMGSTSVMTATSSTIEPQVPIDSSAAIEASSINAGILVQIITATNVVMDECREAFYTSANATVNIEYDLPASGLCSAGSGNEYDIFNGDPLPSYVHPDGTDIIIVAGEGSCGAGGRVQCDQYEGLHIIGRDAGVWFVLTGNCACEP